MAGFNQNKGIIEMAVALAKEAKADAILLYGDAMETLTLSERFPKEIKPSTLFIITKERRELDAEGREEEVTEHTAYRKIAIPKLKLGRLGILKVALIIGIASGDIKGNSKIIYIGGKASKKRLDTLMLIDLAQETELLTHNQLTMLSENTRPDIFEGLLRLAMELANSSREGKAIGTIFVLGDCERVMQLSKQMIMNPFRGYTQEERQILNPLLKETIREFSALDGAFVISEDGEIMAAGRYLGATAEDTEVPRGLGSRHLAAAGITALTKAIAIVISQSTGDIRIFKGGSLVTEIKRQG